MQVTPAAAAPIAATAATPVARDFTVTDVLSISQVQHDVNADASVPHSEFPHELEIAGSVDVFAAPPSGAGKERTMGESERETFGSPREPDLSSEDAAELEELRREAAILREQLENAVGAQGAGRSPRDIHQLEARIDSLASRNSKLMETLKEARQQLLALREEVDRLGQPPSGYGVLLGVQEDDTVDVFTSGRKMRLTCSPNIDTKTLKQGQTVRLNEALTVVEAGNFEAVGEISTLREILSDGHRALVVGHADEERIVWLAEPLVAAEHLPDGYDDEVDDDLRPRKLRPGDAALLGPQDGDAIQRS